MYRSTLLAPSHYAGRWAIPNEDQRNDLAVINQLGYEYALADDSSTKEAKLMVVLEAFHGYLMKYLCMIVRGTLPPLSSHAGRDAKEFLRQVTPRKRGEKMNKETSDQTCKMLHLAFKGMTTEDIYDTMVFCFVKAARRYDPNYTLKTKRVCEEVSNFGKKSTIGFTLAEIESGVDFPATGVLRALVRRRFLASIVGKKKVIGYKVGEACRRL